MQPTERAPRRRLQPRLPSTRHASAAIAGLGAAIMVFLVLSRYLRDASMWLDEASIAYNLLVQSPVELLGALETGHRFPRVYLLTIAGLERALGYHTLVLRALPVSAFIAGAIVWQRLLYRRWRCEPALVLLGTVLTLVPGTWFAYGAMLKQYSLDALLALVPLLVSDGFLDRSLRDGRNRTRLFALALPCMLSYTYVIVLLARLLAWGLASWRSHGRVPATRNLLGLAALVAALLAGLWLTDLRHARSAGASGSYWASCMLDGTASHDLAILGRYLTGWARSQPVFGGGVPVPGSVVWVLMGLLAAGSVVVAWRAVRPWAADPSAAGRSASPSRADETEWGSRSLACLAVILGLWLGAYLTAYPLCPGRTTLFSYFSIVILTLEGGSSALAALQRGRSSGLVVRGLIVCLALSASPAALATIRTLVTKDSPENIRPLLPLIEVRPELPIVIAACNTRQAVTLPEWVGRDDLYFGDDLLRPREDGRPAMPEADRFLVVSTASLFYCPWFLKDLRRRADSMRLLSPLGSTAALFEVQMPPKGSSAPGDQGGATSEPERGGADSGASPPASPDAPPGASDSM